MIVHLESLRTIGTISAQTAMTWSGVAKLCAKGRHSGIKTKTKKESKVPCWRLNTLACWGLQQQREVTSDWKGKTPTGTSRRSRGGGKNGQGADGLLSPTTPTKASMSNAGSRKLLTTRKSGSQKSRVLYKPGALLSSKRRLACRVICLWTYVHSENVRTDGRKHIEQDCVLQFVKFGYILSYFSSASNWDYFKLCLPWVEKVQQNLGRHCSSEWKFIAILGEFFHLQCCMTLETLPREFQPVPWVLLATVVWMGWPPQVLQPQG